MKSLIKSKILLVDDDKLSLDLMEYQLKSHGYEIYKATSAYQALDYLSKTNFKIIVTDVYMPEMSGLGLLSLIKNIYMHKNPIFVVSSTENPEVIHSAYQLNATEFFTKPINFERLVDKIKKHT